MDRTKLFTTLCLALCSSSALASMVTETWTGQVGAISNTTAYASGSTVSWQVSYDDALSTQKRVFNDGSNGVADRGLPDDTLNTLFCVDPTADPTCSASSTAAGGFFRFHDTISDVSAVYLRMVAALGLGEVVSDYWDTNQDSRSFRNVPWGILEQYDFTADDFRLAADNYPFRCVGDCPNTGDGTIQLTYLDREDDVQFAQVTLTRVAYTRSTEAVTLHAPMSLSLLCFGAIAMAGLIHRKAQSRGRTQKLVSSMRSGSR